MKTQVYTIEPFTNMHVGSGKENSGIVDNMVQRDVLSEYPVINSTSLKGALREYYKNDSKRINKIKAVFGMGNEKEDGQEDNKTVNYPGKFHFFNANLLSYPARSDKFPFLHATTKGIISDFLEHIDMLQLEKNSIIDESVYFAFKKIINHKCNEKALCFNKKTEGAVIEYYNIKAHFCSEAGLNEEELKILSNWLGENFVIVNDDIFKKQITDKLPIIARNHLDNGQSTNLWYEEIVPRKTRFYTFVSAKEEDWGDDIDFGIKSIQIGANSSVGYGYSEIKCMTPKRKEEQL